MAQFESLQDEVNRSGAALVFIAAEKRGGMFKPEKYLVEHPISFPFLLDEDRAVTKAYGVYKRLGVDSFNIARPATFVVDAQGVVRYIHVGAGQTDRAPASEILAAVQNLGAGQNSGRK